MIESLKIKSLQAERRLTDLMKEMCRSFVRFYRILVKVGLTVKAKGNVYLRAYRVI